MFVKKVTRPPYFKFFLFFLGVWPGSPREKMEKTKRDIT